MQVGSPSSGRIASTASVAAAVEVIVDACDPEAIVLFGSAAMGQPRLDSDIDVLGVIDDDANWASAGKAALLAVARLEPEVYVIVMTRGRIDANRDQAGSIVPTALSSAVQGATSTCAPRLRCARFLATGTI